MASNETTTSIHCPRVELAAPLSLADERLYVELDSRWYALLALVTTVGLLVSFGSNAIIIYLFSRTPGLRRNPSNVVAVNLSLSDLLYCVQWPSIIYSSVTQSTWILENQLVCQFFGFITLSTALSSILTILFMSIERALVITHPMRARGRFTSRTAWLIILLIWLLSVATSLPPLFGRYNRYTLDPSKTSCTLDYLSRKADYKRYILFLFAFYWIPPFFIISICYALIYVNFRRSSKSLEEVGNETEQLQLRRATVSQRRFSSSTLACNSCRQLDSLLAANVDCNRAEPGSRPVAFWSSETRNRLRDSIRLHKFVGSFSERRPRLGLAPGRPPVAPIESRLGSSETQNPLGAARVVISCVEGPANNCRHEQQHNQQWLQRQQRQSTQCERHSRGVSMFSRRSKTFDGLKRQDNGGAGGGHCGPEEAPQSSPPPQPPPTSQSRAHCQLPTRQTIQIRLARMSFYLIVLWVVSWTPIAWIGVVNSLLECHRTSAVAIFLANTMTKLGPAFDVFIYGVSHPKIKSKFRQILSCSALFALGQTRQQRRERLMGTISRRTGGNSLNLKTSKMLSNRFSARVNS